MGTYEHLLYEQHDNVLVITLNRPEHMNALSPQLEGEIYEALDQAAEDDTIRSIIITGAGKAFSAGYDMLAIDDWRAAGEDTTRATLKGWYRLDGANGDRMMSIMRHPKPIIAAVNGWCLGGAFWIALASDITNSSDLAVYGQPETRQISNTSFLMALLAGWKHTHRYALTGDHFDAQEAERIGIINEVVPHDELLDRSMALAKRLALVPADSVRYNKWITTYGLEAMGLRAALNVNGVLSTMSHSSRDAPEVAHFYEDRKSKDLRGFLEKRDGPFLPEPFGPKSKAKPKTDDVN